MKNILKMAWAAICAAIRLKPKAKPVDPDTVLPFDIDVADIDHAIIIVNNVRNAMASPLAALITNLIPGTIDDKIRQALIDNLPKVAAALVYSKDLLNHWDGQTVLNAVLGTVKTADKPEQDAFAHNLAARILMIVSDGKVNWSLAVQVVEYYFKNIFKPV
ncbi:hypothetical protein AB6735_18725 [Mucilaginibacter sp. RCC_168]|uniref:hypothetical protein n=1 Tax=Mucilaginibacter sp. RCC_168 TaxID=3239221 RepID=UPI0035251E03